MGLEIVIPTNKSSKHPITMGTGTSTSFGSTEPWPTASKVEDGYKFVPKSANGGDPEDLDPASSSDSEGPLQEVVYIERTVKRKASKKSSGAYSKILGSKLDKMNDTGVQTEEVLDEELDWDLSDHVDRETQTLPPNATPSQINRTEAIVQTDCRYIPLDSDARPSTAFENEASTASRELVTVGTQTELETKNSVSTQTDLNEIMSGPSSAMERANLDEFTTCSRIGSRSSLLRENNDNLNEVHRRLSLVAFDGQNALVTSPLIPNNPSQLFDLDFSPPNPSSDSGNDPMEPHVRKDPLELWKRFTPFALDELMPAFKMASKAFKRKKRMIDVSIQTDNDFIGEESPGYGARPPPCSKEELIQLTDFHEIDLHVLTIPDEATKDPKDLVEALCSETENDLIKTRLIFRWIAENIGYDIRYTEKEQTTEEVLKSRSGVAKDYINLFLELSFLAGIRTKKLTGFARGYDSKIGKTFVPGRDALHSWVAVYIYNSWRLIDPTWGAGYMDDHGRFHPVLEEHFFLTEPSSFILTHFPYDVEEIGYDRWQLLDIPITLDDFNMTPKVTPYYFACQLRFRKPKTSPHVFANQTEIQVAASILLRYKYRLFHADETEKEAKNEYVFCQLKEGGVVCSFRIIAPGMGTYILKVFASPDDFPEDEETLTPFVFAFELQVTRARRYPTLWPLHDGVWGPTPRLYECGLDPVNQTSPIINTWGGKKLLYFEKVSDVLLMFQFFDQHGQLLDSKGILKKDESEDQVRLSIVPPGIGYFKLLMYGIQKPQEKGRWRLPLLAAYLVECKMSISQHMEMASHQKKGLKPLRHKSTTSNRQLSTATQRQIATETNR